MNNLVHLHNHTTRGSVLDGFSTPSEMMRRAVDLKQSAIALTDHGTMASAVEFKQAAEAHNIKPIIGQEFYIIPFGKGIDYRPTNKAEGPRYHHQLVIAGNQVGYQNILKLTELASGSGFFYKPRITYDQLAQHKDGLIVTSGCMASEIPSLANVGKFEDINTNKIHQITEWFVDVFGIDHFYIELQEHGIKELTGINAHLLQLMHAYNIKPLITNDTHYSAPEDFIPHTDLLCVQLGQTRQYKGDFIQDTFYSHPDYYIAGRESMEDKFKGYDVDIVRAGLDNTLFIAEMIEPISLGYENQVYKFPELPEYIKPSYHDSLRTIVEQLFPLRYSQYNAAARERIEYELSVIARMGFSSYFLCLYDLTVHLNDESIPFNTRGSAAGSVICYILGVTSIDPLAYNLLFERFLNPDRISAPDVDVDVPGPYRKQIVKYLQEKYGIDQVAQVASFNEIKAKSAIRDAGRVLDIDLNIVDMVAKAIPEVQSGKVSIDDMLNPDSDHYDPGLDQAYDNTIMIKSLIDAARGLEGRIRSTGIHAGAVIISDKSPLSDYVPLVRPGSGSKAITPYLVGLDYETAESLGLMKLDLLGVETLAIIADCLQGVAGRLKRKLTFEQIPIDDPKAFELINSGNLAEIFQLSGHTARQVTRMIKPKTVQDIMAINALARPGPLQYAPLYADRLAGLASVVYDHPDLEPILRDSQGIMIYQEQVMKVAQAIAGFTPGEADALRKATSKKKGFEKIGVSFIEGAVAKGYSEDFVIKLWADILQFSSYGFNQSHAASYSVLAAKLAYLKAYYPLDFYAAALTHRQGKDDKFQAILTEMRALGYKLLPPDIRRSRAKIFTVDEDRSGIRFALGAIKGVGKAAMIFDRDIVGDTISELCAQVKLSKLTKATLRPLILCGAFDTYNLDRNFLLNHMTELTNGLPPMVQASLRFGDSDNGSGNGSGNDEKETPHYTAKEFLAAERELTGFYLSGHPLQKIWGMMENPPPRYDDAEQWESKAGQMIFAPGIVHQFRTHITKRNEVMAFMKLEDIHGALMSVVIWPATLSKISKSNHISIGDLVKVLGRVNVQEPRNEDERIKMEKYGAVSIEAINIIHDEVS